MKKVLFWVGTIFIPFILVFFVWIRKMFGRTGRIVYTIWAAVALLIGILGNAGGNSASTPTSKAQNAVTTTAPAKVTNDASNKTSTTTPPPVKTDPATQLQQIVKDAFGQQFESVDVNDYGGEDASGKGKYVLIIHLKAMDGFNTNQSMKFTVVDIQDSSKQIFSQSKLVYEAVYNVDTQLVDKYGNTSNGLWCRIILEGTDGYKINYDNIDASGFAQLVQFQGFTQDAQQAFQTLVNGN